MDIFFDLKHIFNENYPIDESSLKELLAECEKVTDNFSNKVNLIWEYVSSLYADKLNLIFDLSDKTFKKQLEKELFLRLFNTLSIFTSKHILGVDKFLESTRLENAEKRLTYASKNSFNPFVEHLKPILTEEYFIGPLSKDPMSLSKIPSFKKSNLIMDCTPLSEFINTHLFYKPADKDCEVLLTESDRKNTKVKFFFNKEGRYFLSVLLLAVASKDIPYISKTVYGISLDSINNFFGTLYCAYHEEELNNNLQEKLLFFINTESIFQFTLINKIFLTLAEYFNSSKDNALSTFISSISYITLLSSYPLNFPKITMWDFLSEKNFSEMGEDTSNANSDNLNEVIYQMEEINNMTNCFIYILFRAYGLSSNNPNLQILCTLKKDIFEFLSKSETQDMQWSFLSSSAKKFTKIPSIFNEYFNFYILYYFYNIRFRSTNPSWTTKDLEYSFNWSGYNLYVKYLLSHKK